uniref:THAP domain-containing protein 3 n=1 Tax=Daphnia magna TaxID=35525 RepID=A0A0P5I6K9_9CRUS
MVRPCCICGIKKTSEAASKGIRFFKFPSVKSESHSIWIKTIRHHSKKISRPFTPRRNSIVCTSHFENTCFTRGKRKLQLKQGSIPTIFSFDDSTKEVVSISCDSKPKEVEEKEGNTEQNVTSSVMGDYASDGSSSLSPPVLLPLQELNSDFEETIEDPPDLELYDINRGYDESTGLTSFADLDMIKMDHIGSVADILGPDPYLQDESITMDERVDSSVGEERDEVDGQTILSFASVEEMQEFAHRQASSRLTKTNDFRQIKGWRNKFHQLTPSLSPSPCSSPLYIPANSVVFTSESSKSPTPTIFSSSTVALGPSLKAGEDKQEVTCEDLEVGSAIPTNQHKEPVLESDKTVESPKQVIAPSEETFQHSEQTVESSEDTTEIADEMVESLEESVGVYPELGPDGSISSEYAEYAASAVNFPYVEKRRKPLKKAIDMPDASNTTAPGPKISPKVPKKQPAIKGAQELPSVEIDEVPSSDLVVCEDLMEDVVVQEDEYVEVYDVPGNLEFPVVECGKLFCRLGCVCDTLTKTKNQSKVPVEHCALPECMLQCVCGFQEGKPSSRKCFASLLKGNESFYSKINWSGERRRRERRIPERFSEFHLGNESSSSTSNHGRSPEESKPVEAKSKNSGHHRAGNTHSSRPSSSLRTGCPSQQRLMPQDVGVEDSLPSPSSSRKWEPFRVKVCAEEIKLLRWDSFVSLSKVYVAPDHDIFCMEHSMYGCPCIETDRRIIRIASKYVPLPLIDTTRNADNRSPQSANGAKKVKAKAVASSPPSKNVAKKHTHPNMRLANKSRISPTEENVAAPQEPIARTSSLSKMRKLLNDERFQLQKLMTDEKTRAFDEEVDLAVRQGQTVQLVAWIRFHRIYHAGRIHIRFLSRRAGPVILVMRPTEIVAADITCDIQDMKSNDNSPEIVKELLDPCISPDETSRYAFLLCDGVKWELVGCLTLKTTDAPNPTAAPAPASLDTEDTSEFRKSPPSHQQPIAKKVPVAAFPEGLDTQQQQSAASLKCVSEFPVKAKEGVCPPIPVSLPSLLVKHSSVERINAMEQRRMQLEERLNQIKSKLMIPQAKPIASSKLLKSRNRTSTCPNPRSVPIVDQLVMPEEFPSRSLPQSGPSVQVAPKTARRSKRKPDMAYLIPDQCILPDDMPIVGLTEEQTEMEGKGHHQNLPDLLIDQVIKEPTRSMYPAAEKLAMFSRLIRNGSDPFFNGANYSSFEDTSTFASERVRSSTKRQQPAKIERPPPSPPVVPAAIPPTPSDLLKPNTRSSEVTLLKLQPIGPSLPNGVTGPNPVRRIRILTPQSAMNGTSGSGLIPLLTSRNGIEPNVIQQQRMHWSSKGVKPPVNSKSLATPVPSISESFMSVLAVPTSSAIAPTTSSKSTGCSAEASRSIQPANSKPNQVGTTPTVNSSLMTSDQKTQLSMKASSNMIPDGSTQLLMKANTTAADADSSRAVKLVQQHTDPESIPSSDDNAEPLKETTSSSKSVFPRIVTAEVSTVKSSSGTATRSLKIILEAMEGEHQDLCPSRASMLLPLHNINDQWCLVAIDHVPDSGFQVPGLTVFIPRDVLGRAASTAIERKARVSFPLHFQLKNVGSVFKKGFGVYGTPQLPRHVFLGPFPFNYLENCTPFAMQHNNRCMFLIKLTKPIPSDSGCANEPNQVTRTNKEQAEEVSLSTSIESSDKIVETTPESKTNEVVSTTVPADENGKPDCFSLTSSPQSDEVSVVATLAGASKTATVADQTFGNAESGLLENEGKECAKDSESDGIEIINENVNMNSELRMGSANASVPLQPMDGRPKRMFVARTPGLPPTNIKLFSESSVVVDHPFLRGEKETFTSIDEAKTWLQTLAIRQCKGKGFSSSGSDKSKTSNSADDSLANSEFTEDEEIDVCGQTTGESREQEETVDSASTTSRSPKRIRRLTEKARILAANKSKSSRSCTAATNVVKRSYNKQSSSRMGSSRSTVQRMLHIQKEQERRGLLGKLIRDLDALCAPDSGTRAKIVVLKNATTTVKHLEQQAKELENTYQALKLHRTALLTKREKIFSELPSEVSQIFNCLMESVALPSRHLTVAVSDRSKRNRLPSPQLSDQHNRGRVAVVVPNSALLSEFVNRPTTQHYVLTGVEL